MNFINSTNTTLMSQTVRFVSSRTVNYVKDGEAKSFLIAKVQTAHGSIENIGIAEEDLTYFERGKAYHMGISKDNKGVLRYELGLEVE